MTATPLTALRLTAPLALPCDPACTVLRDAVVDIEADGRLGYCGPRARAPSHDGQVRTLSGMLLPGLVNIALPYPDDPAARGRR